MIKLNHQPFRVQRRFMFSVHRLAMHFRHVRQSGAIRLRVVAACACVLTD